MELLFVSLAFIEFNLTFIVGLFDNSVERFIRDCFLALGTNNAPSSTFPVLLLPCPPALLLMAYIIKCAVVVDGPSSTICSSSPSLSNHPFSSPPPLSSSPASCTASTAAPTPLSPPPSHRKTARKPEGGGGRVGVGEVVVVNIDRSSAVPVGWNSLEPAAVCGPERGPVAVADSEWNRAPYSVSVFLTIYI